MGTAEVGTKDSRRFLSDMAVFPESWLPLCAERRFVGPTWHLPELDSVTEAVNLASSAAEVRAPVLRKAWDRPNGTKNHKP